MSLHHFPIVLLFPPTIESLGHAYCGAPQEESQADSQPEDLSRTIAEWANITPRGWQGYQVPCPLLPSLLPPVGLQLNRTGFSVPRRGGHGNQHPGDIALGQG